MKTKYKFEYYLKPFGILFKLTFKNLSLTLTKTSEIIHSQKLHIKKKYDIKKKKNNLSLKCLMKHFHKIHVFDFTSDSNFEHFSPKNDTGIWEKITHTHTHTHTKMFK